MIYFLREIIDRQWSENEISEFITNKIAFRKAFTQHLIFKVPITRLNNTSIRNTVQIGEKIGKITLYKGRNRVFYSCDPKDKYVSIASIEIVCDTEEESKLIMKLKQAQETDRDQFVEEYIHLMTNKLQESEEQLRQLISSNNKAPL